MRGVLQPGMPQAAGLSLPAAGSCSGWPLLCRELAASLHLAENQFCPSGCRSCLSYVKAVRLLVECLASLGKVSTQGLAGMGMGAAGPCW